MILLFLTTVEVHRLAPDAAQAAQAVGEARTYQQMTDADDAARAKRRGANLFGGLGTTAPSPRGFAPLGDIGQSNFVFTPGSIGARRYKD